MGKASTAKDTRSARRSQRTAKPTQNLRSKPARPSTSRTTRSSVLDNKFPATLELDDIVVTIATYSKKDHEHIPLPSFEYEGDDLINNEVARWVPVPIVNQRFCIHVGYDGESLPYPGAGLRALLYIDGRGPMGKTFVPPKELLKRIDQRARGKPVTTGEMEMRGYETDDGLIKYFRFKPRQTTTDESKIPDNIDEFGKVEVLAYWATKHPPTKFEDEDYSTRFNEPVYERVKKVQHRFQAGVDEAEPDDEPCINRYCHFEAACEEENFWFSFRYSDIEWLKAEGRIVHP